MNKTDTLVDKLLLKAQDAQKEDTAPNKRDNDRFVRAIAELVETQDQAQDVSHKANKLYKFKRTKDGTDATVLDFKTMAAEVREQVTLLLADTKQVRTQMPKHSQDDKDDKNKKKNKGAHAN